MYRKILDSEKNIPSLKFMGEKEEVYNNPERIISMYLLVFISFS